MSYREPDGWQRRRDFEAWVQRHEADAFAHSALINRVLQENLALRENFQNRLGDLEKLQQRIIGGLGVLGLVTTVIGAMLLARILGWKF